MVKIKDYETPPSAGLKLKEFGFYEPALAGSILFGDGDAPSRPDWKLLRP
jgi:hypothetical protein